VKLAAAIFCDAASVRENLLHVLGGGINTVWRSEFPAPLGADLALMFEAEDRDLSQEHNLRVIMHHVDPENHERRVVLQMTANLKPETLAHLTEPPEPLEVINLPVVVPLRVVGIDAPGRYEIELVLNNSLVRMVPFLAAQQEVEAR
jgi:hypothetical protein